MSVRKRTWVGPDGKKHEKWEARWKDGNRHMSRLYDLKAHADEKDREAKNARRLGTLAFLDAGKESLDTFVEETWARIYAPLLAPKTQKMYASLYDTHISPTLGGVPLRELSPERIARWQAERLAAGGGPVAVRRALELLSSILQRATEARRIQTNPCRVVRRAKLPKRPEVQPLSPASIERMRAGSKSRDAVILSVMAYAGLRPGEVLALRWSDVREKTILVERALSLGEAKDTKTGEHRAVRLLGPLAQDLREWRLASGRPRDTSLIFPGHDGEPWSEPAYQSWRRRAFRRALTAAGIERARPYDLRHSFASLLLHEGRSVIYVARQLGHGAQLTLRTYGHVIEELEASPREDAEVVISAARSTSVAHQLRTADNGTGS